MVNYYTAMRADVGEEAIGSAVEVVARNYLVARLQDTQDYIESGHSRRDC
jgi:hypothetical protein